MGRRLFVRVEADRAGHQHQGVSDGKSCRSRRRLRLDSSCAAIIASAPLAERVRIAGKVDRRCACRTIVVQDLDDISRCLCCCRGRHFLLVSSCGVLEGGRAQSLKKGAVERYNHGLRSKRPLLYPPVEPSVLPTNRRMVEVGKGMGSRIEKVQAGTKPPPAPQRSSLPAI